MGHLHERRRDLFQRLHGRHPTAARRRRADAAILTFDFTFILDVSFTFTFTFTVPPAA
jgi:hypothetical protein